MTKIFLVSFHVFLTLFLFGQESSWDSLELTLRTDIPDSTKLKTCWKLSTRFSNLDQNKYRHYSLEGQRLAKKIGDATYEAKFLQELGYYYNLNNKVDSAYCTTR